MNVVVDAAALLCVLLEERGSDGVIPLLRGAHMSAINISESCSRGAERGSSIEAVLRAVRRFELKVHPFDLDFAQAAAELRTATRAIGASLGDRACLVLGRHLELPIITGDRRMARVDPALGIDVRLIR